MQKREGGRFVLRSLAGLELPLRFRDLRYKGGMPEIEKTTSVNAGEMAQRFVQFVIMQSQQILYLLGAPTPDGDRVPANLEAAKLFIDQLEMIQDKTKGNLSSQENRVLDEALTRVRLAFVQVSGTPHSMMPSMTPDMDLGTETDAPPEPKPKAKPAAASPKDSAPAPAKVEAPADDSKKRFVKSYG
jgi:hypothetical protein